MRHPSFAALCRAAGLPEPVAEYRFDPKRRWRFDFAWPTQRIALEVEGGVWIRGRHTRGAGYVKDLEKYNAGVLQGWRIVRVTPQQIVTMGVRLVAEAMNVKNKNKTARNFNYA